jgi:hypothetical protein
VDSCGLGIAQKELVHQSQLDASIGVSLILRIIAPIGAGASAKNEPSSTFFEICRKIHGQ